MFFGPEKLVNKVREYNAAGDIENAKQALYEALRKYPDKGNVLAEASRFNANYTSLDEARQYAVAAMKHAPGSVHAARALGYVYELMAEMTRVDQPELPDILNFLAVAYAQFNCPRVGASLCAILRKMSKIDEASALAEEALAKHPDSCHAQLSMGKIAFSRGDHSRAAAHILSALRINPVETWWNVAFTFTGPISGIIYTHSGASEIIVYLDRLLSEVPGLNLLTPRCTPWHRQSYGAMREDAITKGLPSCLFVPMGKSGSVSLSAIFNSGFGLVSTSYSIGTQEVIPSWAEDYARGGACNATHLWATPRNISALKNAGIDKAIVHVRDPRQTTLSFVHHTAKYQSDYLANWKNRHLEQDLARQIDQSIDTYFRRACQWIKLWINAANELDVTFTTFEEFVSNREALVEKALTAYGGDRRFFHRERAFQQQADTDYHIRSGKIDEWRQVFSPKQIETVNDCMPNIFFEMFNWKK